MNDPYRVLGVSPSVTDEQLRDVYRELTKKYHPDAHQQSPLSDLAEEKMKEINVAYDEIMDMRRGNAGANHNYQQSYSGQTGGSAEFAEIRRQIQSGNLTVADDMLENRSIVRNAEWSFLKGSVCYSRGWLNDAYTHFLNAVNQEPTNMEYKAALNQMMQARQGNMNGNPNGNPYRQNNSLGGCSTCDMCQGLFCADCCCECFGGDLISCC